MAEQARVRLLQVRGDPACKVGAVVELTGLPAHVLRFWEEEFPSLSPVKSRGGQRIYTMGDIELILEIKDLLHEQGFTIAGARRRLGAAGAERSEAGRARLADALDEVRGEIRAILTMMEAGDKL